MYYIKTPDNWFQVYNSKGTMVLRTKNELEAYRALRDKLHESMADVRILYRLEQRRQAA